MLGLHTVQINIKDIMCRHSALCGHHVMAHMKVLGRKNAYHILRGQEKHLHSPLVPQLLDQRVADANSGVHKHSVLLRARFNAQHAQRSNTGKKSSPFSDSERRNPAAHGTLRFYRPMKWAII